MRRKVYLVVGTVGLVGVFLLLWYEFYEYSPRQGAVRRAIRALMEEKPIPTQPIVGNPTRAPDPDRPCEIPTAEEALLSPREECWLELLRERCEEDDVCLVDCFANSRHLVRVRKEGTDWTDSIGGGCWHVCFSYRAHRSDAPQWSEPAAWDQCEQLSRER